MLLKEFDQNIFSFRLIVAETCQVSLDFHILQIRLSICQHLHTNYIHSIRTLCYTAGTAPPVCLLLHTSITNGLCIQLLNHLAIVLHCHEKYLQNLSFRDDFKI